MAQNQNIGLLAQYVAVNTAANSATFSTSVVAGSISIGNSSVNVSINSTAVSTGGAVLISPANASIQYAWTNTQSFSNTITFNGPIVSVNTISANASVGTSGQVLTSGGTGANVYWSTIAGVNVAAQYAWTNTQSFSAVVTHTANVSVNGAIIANGGAGSSGQVLTSAAGGNVYWASASGGFTNGQSISVNNFVVSGTVTANGSTGAAGQTLVSNGAGVNWSSLVPSYNYSAQFNGSQSLSMPTATQFGYGTGDFTIELWAYFNPLTTSQTIVSNLTSASDVAPHIYYGGGTLNFYNGAVRITGSSLSNNTWYHIAVVRISGSTKLYINGTQSGSTYADTNNYGSTKPAIIADYFSSYPTIYGSERPTGFISNVRIVKGVGVYTGNFTVPTSPLQTTQAAGTNIAAITGTQTSLLTCNALTLTDSSPFNNVITNNGGVVASATSNPPFTYSSVSIPTASLTSLRQSFTGDGTTTVFNIAGGYTPGTLSVYYNGLMLRNGSDVTATNGATITMAIAPQSGALIDVVGTVATTYSSITPAGYSTSFSGSQYLTIPDNTAFDFGSGNFTVECWFYLNSAVAYAGIYTKRASNASYNPFQIGLEANGKTLQMYASTNGSSWAVNTGIGVSTGVWYHMAAVRNGTTLTLYLNGVAVATGTVTGALTTNAGGVAIGSDQAAAGGAMINGYISNMRVVKGVAVYTAPFLPVGPLSAVQSVTSTAAAITGTQTSLLTCNGPTIIDGSTNAFTITNNGAATVSTAIVPTFTNVTINTATTTATYSIQALLIGGGGAGGAGEPNPGGDGGGGGGSGGVIQNNINLSTGTVYSIVIGAGGSGGSTTGGNGANTTFAGLTAYGGGGGGDGNGTTPGFGGSGGGAGNEYNASTWSGGCVYGQGYPGGPSVSASTSCRGGSGGGGAGGFGTSRTSAVGGNGGSSISLAITGSTVWYAGGGGGGGSNTNGGGTGGNGFGANQGGGGNGGSTGSVPGTGTTNTGGGGGGGVGHNVGTSYTYGASGGSGIVILSIPTANYTGTTTGSPTVTTVGTNKILTFTASGSYTA